MKNSDMPAMPQERALWVEAIGECPTLATGITKREYFAGLAMQALLSNPNIVGYNSSCGWSLVNCTDEQLSNMSVGHAEYLLAALEHQNDPT